MIVPPAPRASVVIINRIRFLLLFHPLRGLLLFTCFLPFYYCYTRSAGRVSTPEMAPFSITVSPVPRASLVPLTSYLSIIVIPAPRTEQQWVFFLDKPISVL